jgi:adenosine deaminase
MSFKSMPKVELHLHLEGAAPPAFTRGLAKEKSVDLGGIFDEKGDYVYADFAEFLNVYEAATQVLKSPEDFQRLTRAVLEESAAHGVIYSETFLSPDFCGGGDVIAWKEYQAAMQETAEEAERDLGITLRGIITCIRHFGPDKAKQTAKCAAETAGEWITGFGIAGAEMAGQPADFAYSFDMAREAGLQLTAHAGEWGGPEMVADTIRDLQVSRIGHGVHAARDPKLMAQIAEQGIVLEVCPGSNVVLHVYDTWADHPIQTLRDAGIKVTVSTDDPPFFHTTMTDEFNNLAKTFGWGDDDFREMNLNAIDAAFCDDATRTAIRNRLETP